MVARVAALAGRDPGRRRYSTPVAVPVMRVRGPYRRPPGLFFDSRSRQHDTSLMVRPRPAARRVATRVSIYSVWDRKKGRCNTLIHQVQDRVGRLEGYGIKLASITIYVYQAHDVEGIHLDDVWPLFWYLQLRCVAKSDLSPALCGPSAAATRNIRELPLHCDASPADHHSQWCW